MLLPKRPKSSGANPHANDDGQFHPRGPLVRGSLKRACTCYPDEIRAFARDKAFKRQSRKVGRVDSKEDSDQWVDQSDCLEWGLPLFGNVSACFTLLLWVVT
jgi:hypothetical protein